MEKMDPFTEQYEDHLDGLYDCPDRIVLNGYYLFANSPGGFRTWWRNWMGTDENLKDDKLMRLSGRFSRRARAWAKKNGIPCHRCEKGDEPHVIAEEHIPEAEDFVGVFMVMITRSPFPTWQIIRTANGKTIVRIQRNKKKPFINHYGFHIIDPDWGHVTINICGQPPFSAQIIFNGHEYVERQARKQALRFTKEGNCFTEISDAAGLARIAETLRSPSAVGQLTQVCERWIYSACLCFGLDVEDQKRTGFHYKYFPYQTEYSRNLLFQSGGKMEQLFQSVIDHTRAPLNLKTIRTIFGAQQRPRRSRRKSDKRDRIPPVKAVVERPVYDVTVFKIDFGCYTVKIYTKGERVLRVEAIVHNARKVPGRSKIPTFDELVAILQGIVNRFLNVVQSVSSCFIGADALEDLPTPAQVGKARVAGVDVNKPRIRHVLQAVISLAPRGDTFKVSQVAEYVRQAAGWSDTEYKSTQAAYDLKKLRGKGIIAKVQNSRSYEIDSDGIRTAAALLILREKILKPLLAGCAAENTGSPQAISEGIDARYHRIRTEMIALFADLGLAA